MERLRDGKKRRKKKERNRFRKSNELLPPCELSVIVTGWLAVGNACACDCVPSHVSIKNVLSFSLGKEVRVHGVCVLWLVLKETKKNGRFSCVYTKSTASFSIAIILLNDRNVCTIAPYLCRRLAVVSKAQDIFTRLQIFRDTKKVSHRQSIPIDALARRTRWRKLWDI